MGTDILNHREQTDALAVRQSEQFNQLDRTTQGIIIAILDSTAVFRTELQSQHAKHAKMINETNLTIIEEHKKTRRDVIETILGHRQVQGTVASRSDDFDPNTLPIPRAIEIHRRERLVLNILSFPSMMDRPDLVATAHQQTFDWIFRSATVDDLRWDNFQSWLQESDGIYWISGKAGSGKSTLMKYLCNHPRLHQNLAVWAGPIKPTIASFYFWNSGTAMQKSQIGLLRTLLHEILQQHPELIAIVFPHIFEDLKEGELCQRKSLSMNDLDIRVAFKKLVRQRTIPLRLCVLIDGLDEYDGNHADIADLVREFASSETIKLCTSSRPLREFEAAFEHGPCLRLQDLTYQDIVNFVNSKLVCNTRMRQLKERQPKEAVELVEEIVAKADGVFLWVHLVVKSLLDGLKNFDSISDLQRRLKFLPPDLRDLYKHMIDRMDPFYRSHASQLLQIAQHAARPLNLVEFAFASESDKEALGRDKNELLEVEKLLEISEQMAVRIRAQSAGLLEVSATTHHVGDLELDGFRQKKLSQAKSQAKVEFIHRSLKEFLMESDTKDLLLNQNTDRGFNAHHRLMRMFITKIQITYDPRGIRLRAPKTTEQEATTLWDCVHEALQYASNAEQSQDHSSLHMWITELDRVVERKWRACCDYSFESKWHGTHWPVAMLSEYFYWHSEQSGPLPCCSSWQDSFLSLAVQCRLTKYLQTSFRTRRLEQKRKPGRPFLHYAVDPIPVFSLCSLPGTRNIRPVIDPELASLFLENGADPNEKFEGYSAWENVLYHMQHRTPNGLDRSMAPKLANSWLKVCQAMVRHGADPKACSVSNQAMIARSQSALTIISEALDTIFSPEVEALLALLERSGATLISRVVPPRGILYPQKGPS